ncbi:uncharacterized protein LOC113493460 [Trichoplusia ni]|uniref:Uncharacterized protein LOC113493460 n=1 Tax=Trichoplusia ni TaxID=7111 RepID=A0A7E5VG41_TRINI|nr:uncharacterized protein LOC113493460 [Trichoplusia ni]
MGYRYILARSRRCGTYIQNGAVIRVKSCGELLGAIGSLRVRGAHSRVYGFQKNTSIHLAFDYWKLSEAYTGMRLFVLATICLVWAARKRSVKMSGRVNACPAAAAAVAAHVRLMSVLTTVGG